MTAAFTRTVLQDIFFKLRDGYRIGNDPETKLSWVSSLAAGLLPAYAGGSWYACLNYQSLRPCSVSTVVFPAGPCCPWCPRCERPGAARSGEGTRHPIHSCSFWLVDKETIDLAWSFLTLNGDDPKVDAPWVSPLSAGLLPTSSSDGWSSGLDDCPSRLRIIVQRLTLGRPRSILSRKCWHTGQQSVGDIENRPCGCQVTAPQWPIPTYNLKYPKNKCLLTALDNLSAGTPWQIISFRLRLCLRNDEPCGGTSCTTAIWNFHTVSAALTSCDVFVNVAECSSSHANCTRVIHTGWTIGAPAGHCLGTVKICSTSRHAFVGEDDRDLPVLHAHQNIAAPWERYPIGADPVTTTRDPVTAKLRELEIHRPSPLQKRMHVDHASPSDIFCESAPSMPILPLDLTAFPNASPERLPLPEHREIDGDSQDQLENISLTLAGKKTKTRDGLILCSQCQQRKLRSDFTQTQLGKRAQKRKCTPCTKQTIDRNISSSRYRQATIAAPESCMTCSHCQQAKLRSQFSRSQMGESAKKRRCLECMTSVAAADTKPVKFFSCSRCLQDKPRSQFSSTQMGETSASKRKCIECARRKPKSCLSCSQCRQTKLRSDFSRTQVFELATKRKCLQCTADASKTIQTTDLSISCSQCRQIKPRSEFSTTQFADTPSSTRKCIQCATSKAAATKRPVCYISCSRCQQDKPRSQFSSTQSDDTPSPKRKCIECTATSAAMTETAITYFHVLNVNRTNLGRSSHRLSSMIPQRRKGNA